MIDNKKQTEVVDGTEFFIRIFRAFLVLVVTACIGWFVYANTMHDNARFPFKLGLDLAGGSQLTYSADVSKIAPDEVPELMEVLREVIEKRINIFGVSEPNVQVEKSSVVAGVESHRLIVELPGVTDVDEAIKNIGKTPLLEFKLVDAKVVAAQQSAAAVTANASGTGAQIGNVTVNGEAVADMNPYLDTGLTGRYLASAALEFTSGSGGKLAN